MVENKRPLKLRYYRGYSDQLYRWSLRSGNGEIVGAATQGYSRKEDAEFNAELILNLSHRQDIEVFSL